MVTSGIPGVTDVIREINSSSDRSAAVVGGALIDEIVKQKIRKFLRQDAKSLDAAFQGSGPLASFNACINIGYLLGLYGVKVRDDLHRIRQIRNEFAHQLTATFSTQKIKDLSLALYLADRYSEDLELAPIADGKKQMPANLMDLQSWIYVPDREQSLKDPRERFIIALQTLAWALSGDNNPLRPGELG